MELPKVQIHWDTVVRGSRARMNWKRLELKNVKTSEATTLSVTGAFIAIGMVPNTAWLKIS